MNALAGEVHDAAAANRRRLDPIIGLAGESDAAHMIESSLESLAVLYRSGRLLLIGQEGMINDPKARVAVQFRGQRSIDAWLMSTPAQDQNR